MNRLEKTINAINKAKKEGLITTTAQKGFKNAVDLINELKLDEAKELLSELHKNEFDLINIRAGERVKKGNASTRLICRLSMNILDLQSKNEEVLTE